MGRKRTDYTGRKFGRLTVIGFSHSKPKKGGSRTYWKCKCECGNETTILGQEIPKGNQKSCGCLRKEIAIERTKKINLGYKHGYYGSKTHNSWKAMKQRCCWEKHVRYKDYGGRGITVCDRWKDSFVNFLEDMGERPEGTTIDRKNNDGNYEPSNCRWATPKEQANNTSRSKKNKKTSED